MTIRLYALIGGLALASASLAQARQDVVQDIVPDEPLAQEELDKPREPITAPTRAPNRAPNRARTRPQTRAPGPPVITGRSAPPSVLAILAHPDDEITIAPVLARIAREGGAVTLIYATSGDAGPGTSGLERAEAIGAMREKEGRCAAFALGLEEPEFWNLGDGGLATMARAPQSPAREALARIKEAIAKAGAEVIMTWGPDGGYGHADHRMISALVTQAVAQLGSNRPELLYAAFPKSEGNPLPGFESWATTSADLITDTIRYLPDDLNATEIAVRCYESQFPRPAREGLVRLLHGNVWQGKIHFRMAFTAPR